MNKKLKLSFLWHMHQPYYKDDKSGMTMMPWCFLHAIKDYYDMPWYAKNFTSIKATYNLVPSLINQLKSYIHNSANDILLETLKKPIFVLNDNDKKILNDYLFLSHEQNMIKPLTRYYNLYLKYKAHNFIDCFTNDELLDCEVLFLLSWCGNYLRQNNDTVIHLLKKEQYFSQDDKIDLINSLINFLPTIFDFYKEQHNLGKIAISTTPYYHPITPLLLDINSANEAKVNVQLPNITADFHQFAVENTQEAITYFTEIFGFSPTGFWPAEGSVSLKTASLFANNGIKWFCTDEEILYKTLYNNEKKNIYKNYQLDIDEKIIDVRFRDHYLSDAIGFNYSQKEPHEAAKDFIKYLQEIYNSCEFSPLVNIILDGENAWEFFKNNAQDFFTELYKTIEETPWIESITMDEISDDNTIKTTHIHNLASGSWINGNFDIWIGQVEKNKAWELLNQTFNDFQPHKEHLDKAIIELINKEFKIALGSDWFWWYGDDHFTVQAAEFDKLFRKHLINIYEYMNIDVPNIMYVPIIRDKTKNSLFTKPKEYIYPNINGAQNDYFEWLNSGIIDISKEFSVMDSRTNIVEILRYGYNEHSFYLLFDVNSSKLAKNSQLKIVLDHDAFVIDIIPGRQKLNILGKEIELFCSKDYIEMQIVCSIQRKNRIKFKFQILTNDKVVQSFPIYNDFFVEFEDLNLKNWFV